MLFSLIICLPVKIHATHAYANDISIFAISFHRFIHLKRQDKWNTC